MVRRAPELRHEKRKNSNSSNTLGKSGVMHSLGFYDNKHRTQRERERTAARSRMKISPVKYKIKRRASLCVHSPPVFFFMFIIISTLLALSLLCVVQCCCWMNMEHSVQCAPVSISLSFIRFSFSWFSIHPAMLQTHKASQCSEFHEIAQFSLLLLLCDEQRRRRGREGGARDLTIHEWTTFVSSCKTSIQRVQSTLFFAPHFYMSLKNSSGKHT